MFDGKSGPYSEESATNPLSVYGQAKRDAELALEREFGGNQLTIRTSWVFGPERQGKNFAYQLLRNLAEKKPTICPSDQISNPSYGPDVARAAVLLAEEGASGLIHVVGPDVIDRLRFALRHCRCVRIRRELGCWQADRRARSGTPRPLNGGLKTPRLDASHPELIRPLAAALKNFRDKLLDRELASWIKQAPGFP